MGFLGYFLRRLSLVIPTLVGVTIITFTLTYVLPGNPAVVKAGPLVSPEVVKELEKEMGLDQPFWVQYGRYIGGVLHGDLGNSASTGRPVLEDFRQRLPATFELTLASLLIALLFGIPLGVQSAV
ncbi:MAG TPA: ABC transporter permease, partial [Reyranella sp.]